METTVEERPPVVRCYECGSSQISALCHHCWRPGCAKHVLPSPPWAKRLFGGEGGGPGMQNARARHCRDCAHARAGTAGATRRWLAVGLAGTGLSGDRSHRRLAELDRGGDLPPGRRAIRRCRLSACPPRRRPRTGNDAGTAISQGDRRRAGRRASRGNHSRVARWRLPDRLAAGRGHR